VKSFLIHLSTRYVVDWHLNRAFGPGQAIEGSWSANSWPHAERPSASSISRNTHRNSTGQTVLETSTKNHQQPVHLLTASHEMPPEKGVREPLFNAQNVQLFIGLGISGGDCGSLSNLFLQ